MRSRLLVGLALEVRDLVSLCVRAVLRVRELVLGFTFALLLAAFAPQARVTGEIAGGLLRTACQLVENAHFHCLLRFVLSLTNPRAALHRNGLLAHLLGDNRD